MDPKSQALETWDISNRLTLYLLDNIEDNQLSTKLEKSKTVEGQLAHIHNVRLMWLKASAPDLHEALEKLEPPNLGRQALADGLENSSIAIRELLSRSWDAGGKVKNFKPHVTAFLGYLIAHEAFHRAHLELALRQSGRPLTDKVSYGMWEWGVR